MEVALKSIGVSLSKAILEVRYERSFLFDELQKQNNIAKELRKEFPHSQKDPNNNNALLVVNPHEKTMVAVLPDMVSVNSEGLIAFSNFKSKAKKGIEVAVNALEIDEFTRVGLRLMFEKPFESIELANNTVREKLLKVENTKIPGTLYNPNINFSLVVDRTHINVSIRTSTNFSVEISNNQPINQNLQNSITIDLDVFLQENLQMQNLNAFINSSSEIALEKLRVLEGFLKG